MAEFLSAREKAARRKAGEVARYYHAHKNFIGHYPTLLNIANKMGFSISSARRYLKLAREKGLIDD